MQIRVFCDIAPSSLGIDRRFRGAYCQHRQRDHPPLSLMTDSVGTSEALGYSNDTTRHYVTEGCYRLQN
jgi:hypothetical protein